MTRWVPPCVAIDRVTVPPSAAIRPRLCGTLTLIIAFATVADKRLVTDEPLKCPVGSIANDCHCGSYLDITLRDFRKFVGRASRLISPVLRITVGARRASVLLTTFLTEDLYWIVPSPLLTTCPR